MLFGLLNGNFAAGFKNPAIKGIDSKIKIGKSFAAVNLILCPQWIR